MSTTATMENKNIKLQLTRVFDAPRELVFKAWTDAKQFQQWFGAAACDGISPASSQAGRRIFHDRRDLSRGEAAGTPRFHLGV
jgi:uncharacterized protein YndB with AHSA1/START domain